MQSKSGYTRGLSTWAFIISGLCAPASAHAQSGGEARSNEGTEIVVTARRRAESELAVPVALTALSRDQLELYGTKDLGGLATRVPSLMIAQVTGGSGGSISLRGISSSATNPSIDQAVALNVDGVQLGSAYMVRLAQIDMQQIEVLKGPQALFFGKNSPGGVISYTTADPGDSWEGYARGGYESNAREWTGEAAVGGPITETIGARVTAFGTTMKGDRVNRANVVPALHAFGPDRARAPYREEFFVRGTLIYSPSDALKVRAKYSYSHLNGSSPWHTAERIACPNGSPQVGFYGPTVAIDDCKANGILYQGIRDPALTAPYAAEFGKEGTRTTQHLASLQIDYEFAPSMSASSVTGYYRVSDDTYGNSYYAPVSALISGTEIDRRDFTQELRLTTDRSEWPVNLTLGGFYQDTDFANAAPVVADAFALGLSPNPGTPRPFFFTENFVDTKAYSVFGQAIWKITSQIELAGGARWSKETKELTVFNNRGYGGGAFFPGVDHLSFTDTSPEVTISWRPTQMLMVFGAFRNGFKSGGFNTSGNTATLTADPSYKPEDAQGFEAGLKFQSNDVRFAATTYTYEYKNMQVSTFDPIRVAQLVTNAASARIKGIELEIDWKTPLEGLRVHAAGNYNHGRYSEFLVGCYTGQTIAAGCNTNPSTTGVFRQQDFKGRQLYLSPDWTGSAGFNYTTPINSRMKVGFSGDAVYKSAYFADLEQAPLGRQQSSWMLDASVRVADQDDRWEFAVIGNNLTKVYRSSLTAQVSLTGRSAFTGTNNVGGLADLNGQINRGRQVRAQFTYRFR